MDKTKNYKTLFGTDGIRCTYGEFPLKESNIILLGNAIALWAKKKYHDTPTVLIGCDTRESSDIICIFLSLGLSLDGIKIYDAHIAPTPTITRMVQHDKRFDFGIMITASHNPYQDNGIKIIDKKTGKISKADEETITNLFYNEPCCDFSENDPGMEMITKEIEKKYINTITSYFEKDFLKNTKVALDCAHGATFKVAPKIFETLGAEIITINHTPNGININKNCGSTRPERLQKTVLKHKADIGFAFDGDGDRITVVNKHGEIKDGDDIACLLSEHPEYKNQTSIVGTIMSNYGLELHLESQGKKLIRTDVGDKYISRKMKEHNLLLGAEQSGHIILGDYLHSGDGIFAALRVCQVIKHTDNSACETFKKCPQVKINIPVKTKKDLSCAPCSEIIIKHSNMLKTGRLIVRYSGTENLLRVTAEAKDSQVAENICMQISKQLEKELN